uniref:Cnd1 domain-containing protein n=1 Tax=Heterorhabditis bacteriophora TaxID=37862 RepID=A0A1I7WLS7_HETBA
MHGALADSARCFLDPVPSIANLTRLFFNELGKKGSVIYNLMPDFISRLSRNSREMPLPKFKIIFQHLVKLLKDKHADALVEKICHRFELAKSTHGTAKNRDLALYFSFCVSLFPLNDRSFYKVRDALPVYSSFLEDQRIYNDFLSSLQPLIRTTKNIDVKVVYILHNNVLLYDIFNIICNKKEWKRRITRLLIKKSSLLRCF